MVPPDKRALYETGLYLVALSDEGLETKQLKAAIEQLNQLVYARENLPF